MTSIRKILYATDLGPESATAFAHALRIAVDLKARLYLLNVADRGSDEGWSQFPHVREMLRRWGLMDPNRPPGSIEKQLGVSVAKVSMRSGSPREAIARFAGEHDCDLLVLWTHERSGLQGWLSGSMAGDVARAAGAMTLFLPGTAPGFVDMTTGGNRLQTVLAPVDDSEFDPAPALGAIQVALGAIAPAARIHYLHVGSTAPRLQYEDGRPFDKPVLLRQGAVVETIVATAREIGAGLIAMPTAGRQSVFDALRGSTTERVLREARLPLLAAPTQTIVD